MNFNKKLLMVAVVSIFSSEVALAADGDAPAGKWTGFKLGAGAGASLLHSDTSNVGDHSVGRTTGPSSDDIFTGTVSGKSSDSRTSAIGTVEAIYDYQANNDMVFGLVASYDFGSSSKNNANTVGTSYSNYDSFSSDVIADGESNISSSVKIKDTGALGFRIGKVFNENYLPYVTGGWTSTHYNQRATYTSSTIPSSGPTYDYSASLSNSGRKDGFFIGAGLESKFTDNVSLKVEYRYSDFGTVKIRQSSDLSLSTGNLTPLTGTGSFSSTSDLNTHAIRATLVYSFK